MQQLTNKRLTWIVIYSMAVSSLLFWVYQFGAFVLGYSYVLWKEPNILIAGSELMMVLIGLTILIINFKRFINYVA